MRKFLELLELSEVRPCGLPSVCAGNGCRPSKGRRHLRNTALPIASLSVGGDSLALSTLIFERIVDLEDGVDGVLKSGSGGLIFAISEDAAAGRPSRLHNDVLNLLKLYFSTPFVMKPATKWCK
jgi:hypothetical protein